MYYMYMSISMFMCVCVCVCVLIVGLCSLIPTLLIPTLTPTVP